MKVRQPDIDLLVGKGDSVLNLLTDFTSTVPPMLEESTGVLEAESLMRREHCNYKIVVASDEISLGIVTLLDLQSSATLRASTGRGMARHELTIADVMVPGAQLHSVLYGQFSRSSAGEIVNLLLRLGERFLLVLDDDSHTLRGLVSARTIARKMDAKAATPHVSAQVVGQV